MCSLDWQDEIAMLLRQYAIHCSGDEEFGTMSSSVYDTAWVSMILAETPSFQQWLFPDAFQYILDKQLSEGGWPSYADPVDGILNTAAALLSMLKHLRIQGASAFNSNDRGKGESLRERIDKGSAWLQSSLDNWDVNSCNHVGFEVLVPALLGLLSDYNITFHFPGAQTLRQLNATKLANFKEEMFYTELSTSLLHSLEAFVGQLDFEKVQHHLINGSLMGSPAATAAYLINLSHWDTQAEEYLRRACAKDATSSFPCAFPTSVFESSWILSALLACEKLIESKDVISIAGYLNKVTSCGNEAVGFAPGILADADDTSKTLQVLAITGHPTSATNLISTFYNGSYFRTYCSERNSSVSTNCNALKAILLANDMVQYTTEIASIVVYLCDSWQSGHIKDKWHMSDLYSSMLLCQTFILLLRRFDAASLSKPVNDVIEQRVPLVLTQVLSKVLSQQEVNGSWGLSSIELTSYGILALIALADLPLPSIVREEVETAIRLGKIFLVTNYEGHKFDEHLWIEKVTCAMPNIAKAYCLAAIAASSTNMVWSDRTKGLIHMKEDTLKQFSRFFSLLPMFKEHDRGSQLILMSLFECSAMSAQFRKSVPYIFPRDGMTKANYLEYIPFTWIGCKNLLESNDNDILLDMMVISALNFQVDEYMEAVVATQFGDRLDEVEMVINNILASNDGQVRRNRYRSSSPDAQETARPAANTPPRSDDGSDSIKEATVPLQTVETILRSYVDHVLKHPKVMTSPSAIRSLLRSELQAFLLAHVAQIKHSMQMYQKPTAEQAFDPGMSYYRWVRSISGDHTSCPFSFVFFSCLISAPGKACFQTAKQRYLAQDMCRHLATMCRQYNDYGSVARDREEKNLNSIDFAEFNDLDPKESPDTAREAVDDAKKQLMWLAEYERDCLTTARQRLSKEVSPAIMDKLALFINVTDLYGQIYVARDIASRRQI